MTLPNILATLGAILIFAGLGLIVWQKAYEQRIGMRPQPRAGKIGMKGVEVKTTYVGLVVMGFGVVLELAALAV
jgi:hypothetical protein